MSLTANDFREKLSVRLGLELELVVNENRSTMLSILDRGAQWVKLSAHKMFLEAPEEVVNAVVDFVMDRGRQWNGVIQDYIQRQIQLFDWSHHVSSELLRGEGRVYDLIAIFDELNEAHFSGRLNLGITWYRYNRKVRGKKHITLGMYYETLRLIKINDLLDNERFPFYFVRTVVYHEMLHHVYPPYVDDKGTLRTHNKEFKEQERKFVDYKIARDWEKKNKKWFFEGE
ncbi:hypothetical protein JYU14_01455 [Simkania negevensis]|uniref:SprT-like domain-containing protein n=1 Tax=Simkania negevensis TaxID=83561 RepID=A0ABS3ARJ6_9BACT|nr:hypothetical protein [Simkania negevensis]